MQSKPPTITYSPPGTNRTTEQIELNRLQKANKRKQQQIVDNTEYLQHMLFLLCSMNILNMNKVTIKPKSKKHFCAIKPIEIRRLVIRVTSKRSQLQLRSISFAKCHTRKKKSHSDRKYSICITRLAFQQMQFHSVAHIK